MSLSPTPAFNPAATDQDLKKKLTFSFGPARMSRICTDHRADPCNLETEIKSLHVNKVPQKLSADLI